MSLFHNLFCKRPKRSIQDPDFGFIEERRRGFWEGQNLELWGYSSIQVMIDATREGPATEHRSFLNALQFNRDGIRETIEAAIVKESTKTTSHRGPLKLTSIFLPSSPKTQTWRVWYEFEGEDDYSYGAEITKWKSVVPFTED